MRFSSVATGRDLAFHFGVSLGVQHQNVRLETLYFPFPLPEDLPDPAKGRRILKRVVKEFSDARRLLARTRLSSRQTVLFREDEDDNTSSVMHGLRGRLEALVHGYFGLSDEESDMVADTSAIVRKSAMPSSPQAEIATLQPINAANSTCLLSGMPTAFAELSIDGRRRTKRIMMGHRPDSRATYASFDTIGQCLVTLQLGDETRSPSAHTTPRRDEIRLSTGSPRRTGNIGPFTRQRTVIHGSSAAIRILKPAVQGEWTRIAALNDADQIFGAIVTGKRPEEWVTSGNFFGWDRAFPRRLLPLLFKSIIDEWPRFVRPRCDLENRITHRFVGHLQVTLRGRVPFGFYARTKKASRRGHGDSRGGHHGAPRCRSIGIFRVRVQAAERHFEKIRQKEFECLCVYRQRRDAVLHQR